MIHSRPCNAWLAPIIVVSTLEVLDNQKVAALSLNIEPEPDMALRL